ncbi:hypothetical protein Ancab_006168 [Ancistrocladus abbreviatus]
MVNSANFSGTDNSVRIKTWQGGSGVAKNIVFQNIVMKDVSNPIIIDQNYCDRKTPCKQQDVNLAREGGRRAEADCRHVSKLEHMGSVAPRCTLSGRLGTVGLASVGLERPPRELAVDEVNGPTQPVGYLGSGRRGVVVGEMGGRGWEGGGGSGINPAQGRIEKWVLRRAFDDEERICQRQKEQFSDGVGYSWIDGLKAHAEQHVTNKMMQNAANIYPHNTPTTKEAYYYRMIFERFLPQVGRGLGEGNMHWISISSSILTQRTFGWVWLGQNGEYMFETALLGTLLVTVPGGPSVACSTAKAVEWDAAWSKNLDPSGRAALGVHNAGYDRQMQAVASKNMPGNIINDTPRIMGVSTPSEVAIHS